MEKVLLNGKLSCPARLGTGGRFHFIKTGGLLLFALLCGMQAAAQAQQKYNYTYTLEEVLTLAQDQSPDAVRTRSAYLASYWQYRAYRANRLPSLSFSASFPDFSNQYTSVPIIDSAGSMINVYSSSFINQVSGILSISQNLPTGGVISVLSSLDRQDRFLNSLEQYEGASYRTTPVSVNLRQSIFGVNEWKWDRKIEPLRYEEARRNYLKQMETISLRAIQYFFDLAAAQQSLAIAEFNYANNDTLHKIAQGRYNIGTIGENDLLQSELNYLTAGSTLNQAQLDVETSQNRLRSFLGFNELVTVAIILPTRVPKTILDLEEVMVWSRKNNPDLIGYQRQLIEAEKSVASEKANTGLQADINLSFGLNQTATDFVDAYKDPRYMETARISLQIPILDWGRGKGRVRMAKSNQQVVQTQIDQALADFEQDVVLKVRQFNMQETQFGIAAKSDTVAQKRYEVSKARFLIDKITITDMNNAQLDRDRSQQNFVNALRNYWNYYYLLRQIALFDFIGNKPLEADFDELIK
ncbi:MAG: TolC family protein [Prevotellaceae bacterium]|jgi:outer membrane protein TolC|nr:TolC family protein [Prevotellaceae bacterium]